MTDQTPASPSPADVSAPNATPIRSDNPACNYDIDGWCHDTKCMRAGVCKLTAAAPAPADYCSYDTELEQRWPNAVTLPPADGVTLTAEEINAAAWHVVLTQHDVPLSNRAKIQALAALEIPALQQELEQAQHALDTQIANAQEIEHERNTWRELSKSAERELEKFRSAELPEEPLKFVNFPSGMLQEQLHDPVEWDRFIRKADYDALRTYAARVTVERDSARSNLELCVAEAIERCIKHIQSRLDHSNLLSEDGAASLNMIKYELTALSPPAIVAAALEKSK